MSSRGGRPSTTDSTAALTTAAGRAVRVASASAAAALALVLAFLAADVAPAAVLVTPAAALVVAFLAADVAPTTASVAASVASATASVAAAVAAGSRLSAGASGAVGCSEALALLPPLVLPPELEVALAVGASKAASCKSAGGWHGVAWRLGHAGREKATSLCETKREKSCKLEIDARPPPQQP